MTHTPSPWHIENRYADYVAIEGPEGDDGYCPEIAAIEIDEHGGALTPEQSANASLIAASPLLREYAEKENEVDRHRDSCPWCNDRYLCAWCDTALDQEQARELREVAIAAVKGGTQ